MMTDDELPKVYKRITTMDRATKDTIHTKEVGVTGESLVLAKSVFDKVWGKDDE